MDLKQIDLRKTVCPEGITVEIEGLPKMNTEGMETSFRNLLDAVATTFCTFTHSSIAADELLRKTTVLEFDEKSKFIKVRIADSSQRGKVTGTTDKLPPDKIVVKGGKVVMLEEWTLWNGNQEITLTAKRESSGEFVVFPIDPEHGGTSLQRGKTMDEAAAKALHPDIAKKLAELFNLENPTEEQIRNLHYRKGDGLEVIFQ